MPVADASVKSGRSIAILGGGLMGRLLAWTLARRGDAVSVYDAAPEHAPAAAAHTAAAMVAPWAERPVCSERVFTLGCESLRLWPSLLAEVSRESGMPVRWNDGGTLIVAHRGDQAEFHNLCAYYQRQQWLPNGREIPQSQLADSPVQILNAPALRQLEPGLSTEFQQGLWLPEEGQVDNRQLWRALEIAAGRAQAKFHYDARVTDLEGHPLVNGRSLHADCIIDCRGTGGRSASPVRGVRGETVWLQARDVTLSRPIRLLHPRYHFYLVPRGQGTFQLGATELESEDRSPVSVRSAMEMLSALWTLAPGFAEARILSMEANLRPATPTHEPEISRLGNQVRVNGLFRHGFLLAPALIAPVLACVDQDPVESVDYLGSHRPEKAPVSEAAVSKAANHHILNNQNSDKEKSHA